MRPLGAITTATVALTAGCGVFDFNPRGRECESHGHCDGGLVCYRGFCLPPGQSEAHVYADLTPPNTSSLWPQSDTMPRDLAAGLTQELQFTSLFEVQGTVRGAGSDGTLRVGRLPPSAPAPLLPSAQTNRAFPVTASGDDGLFTLQLARDGSYLLELQPHDPGRPPLHYGPFGAVTALTPLGLDYPQADELVALTGTVIFNSSATGSVVSGVRVEARWTDEATTLRSTVAETDLEGRFTLSMPPGVGSPVRVSLGPGSNPAVPSGEVEARWTPGAAPGDPGVLEPIALEIISAVPVSVAVLDSAGVAAPGVRVVFRGERVGIGAASVEGTTDAAGRVDATLLPGRYRILAAPPATQRMALASVVVCVALPDDAQLACDDGTVDVDTLPRLPQAAPYPIELPSGVKILGQVGVARTGARPVHGARVTFRALGSPLPRSFSANTSSSGSFELYVDGGAWDAPQEYEVVVEPEPFEPPLARHTRRFSVGAQPIVEIELEVDEAALVHGVVLSPGGDPLAGVRIDLYAPPASAGASPAAPLLVGQGQSNDAGEFVIPVPQTDPP